MKHIFFVTRADDAGSSRSANAAIKKVIRAGFLKNVSIMAPGAFIDDAAAQFGKDKRVCFGMHGTLNAEWDRVKWGPVADLPKDSGLVDGNGAFLADPKLFLTSKPPVELVLREYEAQLDKLTRAGFDIRYVDSHMFAETGIPGMDEAVADFAKRKGLLDHMYYYHFPPGLLEAAARGENLIKLLRGVPDGQYFFAAHPALDTDEMRQTGNATYRGEDIAKARGSEAKTYGSPLTKVLMRSMGIRPLRYDEATPLPERLSVRDVQRSMEGKS